MDPLTIMAMITASLAFLKEAIPQVRQMADRGEISKEEQEKLMKEYNSLRERADGQFSGPEWEKSGR